VIFPQFFETRRRDFSPSYDFIIIDHRIKSSGSAEVAPMCVGSRVQYIHGVFPNEIGHRPFEVRTLVIMIRDSSQSAFVLSWCAMAQWT
jgi:hypothetical protein